MSAVIGTAAADAIVDTVPGLMVGGRVTRQFRATYHGCGGAATIGYGSTEAAARAHLAAVLAFNLARNGRLV